MADLTTTLLAWLALPQAWVINPLLLALLIHANRPSPDGATREPGPERILPTAAMLAVLLNVLAPLALHASRLPISRPLLAATHLALAAILYTLAAIRRIPLSAARNPGPPRPLLALLGIAILLVLPYTRFTGIDTYKWQDLACNMAIEQRIPWLVHPLSLLGFTPRSYPSAQPLLLGGINILTGRHIDLGFGLLSILTVTIGTLAAWTLGRACFPAATARREGSAAIPPAILFAAFYVLNPVFMRYAHWATGRGLFAALSPFFLHAALTLTPQADPTSPTDCHAPRGMARLRGATWFIVCGALLLLTHKVSLVYLPLVCLAVGLGRLLPLRPRILILAPAVALAVVAACAITPPALLPRPFGNVLGLVRFGITRLGWLLPPAVLALALAAPHPRAAVQRRLAIGALIAIPLAYEAQMYGALVALPFVVCFATAAVLTVRDAYPAAARHVVRISLALALAGSLAVIVQRSCDATPGRIKRAALFLEQVDPTGPFTITAPGRARTQIQAYVSGCPRFAVASAADGAPARVRIAPPPGWRGSIPATLRAWADYGRRLFDVSDLATDWYGRQPTAYYIRIDNQGALPPRAKQIYNRDGVEILRVEPEQMP